MFKENLNRIVGELSFTGPTLASLALIYRSGAHKGTSYTGSLHVNS